MIDTNTRTHTPIQAEEDLAFVAKEAKVREVEAKVMAGVDGWKVCMYVCMYVSRYLGIDI